MINMPLKGHHIGIYKKKTCSFEHDLTWFFSLFCVFTHRSHGNVAMEAIMAFIQHLPLGPFSFMGHLLAG